jgi:hypothetical protein
MNNLGVSRMKKAFLFSTFTGFMLILSACGSRAFRTIPTIEPQTDSSGMTTNYQNAVPIETQLLIGTFKLEGTDQAVSAKQAADLTAYWQVLKELTTSGSSAQEEVDATVSAIESAMTPEQLKAIASMQITRQDMFTILREQGGGFGTGTQNNQSQGTGSQGTGRQSQGNGNQRNFNFGPPGGFEGGGGGFPQGGGFGTQQTNSNRSSNSQSTNGNNFTSTRVPSALLDAVIKLLQEKTQS